jgi:hypothetical protein
MTPTTALYGSEVAQFGVQTPDPASQGRDVTEVMDYMRQYIDPTRDFPWLDKAAAAGADQAALDDGVLGASQPEPHPDPQGILMAGNDDLAIRYWRDDVLGADMTYMQLDFDNGVTVGMELKWDDGKGYGPYDMKLITEQIGRILQEASERLSNPKMLFQYVMEDLSMTIENWIGGMQLFDIRTSEPSLQPAVDALRESFRNQAGEFPWLDAPDAASKAAS